MINHFLFLIAAYRTVFWFPNNNNETSITKLLWQIVILVWNYFCLAREQKTSSKLFRSSEYRKHGKQPGYAVEKKVKKNLARSLNCSSLVQVTVDGIFQTVEVFLHVTRSYNVCVSLKHQSS